MRRRDVVAELRAEDADPEPFDLGTFLRRWYPEATAKQYRGKTGSTGTLYPLDQCPFNLEHRRTAGIIHWEATNTITFRCFHRSCSQYRWDDFLRLHTDPHPHWQTQSDPKTKYRLYLGSPEWRSARDRFLDYSHHLCAFCGGRATEVHHKDYSFVYREGAWDTLAAVCRKCHQGQHADQTLLSKNTLVRL